MVAVAARNKKLLFSVLWSIIIHC